MESELTYVVMPAIGPGLIARRGSIADLVLSIPYLVTTAIPPRRVLNDVLLRGFHDAGMSGGAIWKPLELEAPEFTTLVAELQRRGTRAKADYNARGDPVQPKGGGEPFELAEVPDRVATYRDFVKYRYEQALHERHETGSYPDDDRWEPAAAARDRWLDRLPVANLYLAYLDAHDRDWREHDADAFELPAELVERLRELAGLYHEWWHGRGGVEGAELRREADLAARREVAAGAIRDCVDDLELPRWPFDRYQVPPRPSR